VGQHAPEKASADPFLNLHHCLHGGEDRGKPFPWRIIMKFDHDKKNDDGKLPMSEEDRRMLAFLTNPGEHRASDFCRLDARTAVYYSEFTEIVSDDDLSDDTDYEL
jgi:hypothetical protein